MRHKFSFASSISPQLINEQLLAFFSRIPGDCYTALVHVSVHEPRTELIRIVRNGFDKTVNCVPRVLMLDPRFTHFVSDSVYMTLDDPGGCDLWLPASRGISITLHGQLEVLTNLARWLKSNFPPVIVPVVIWEFISDGQRNSQHVKIEPAKPIFNEFYPWIDDVDSYYDDFMASEESVLILLGETGTGKTSFIRNLIWKKMLTTMFTYEEVLLRTDAMFVQFLLNDNINMLVVEDADEFLTSRGFGNKVMAKFLNVSDGLANSGGKKKIIFTANVMESSKIDEAMLRDGRCFDHLMFRRLTHQEAVAAAKAASFPVMPPCKDYTLAELFSLTKKKRTVHNVGFAR
jgi:hypothetical protein